MPAIMSSACDSQMPVSKDRSGYFAITLSMPVPPGMATVQATALGSAAMISFMVGTLALLSLVLWTRELPALDGMRQLHWWHWLGGLMGALFIATAAYAAPRAGALLFMLLVLAGQMAMAMLLDHFGWAGYRESPVSPAKLAGLGLVVAGIALIQRG